MKTAFLLALALAACNAKTVCPAAYQPDRAHKARISALLARDPDARPLVSELRGRTETCFAPGGAGVVSGDTLLLDRDSDDAHLAARTAHLLAHRAAGAQRTSGDPRRADEVDAVALERRVLQRMAATR
jgi:hypothetical protein